MKRENDFYFFLSFITFYTILLIWYTYFITTYERTIPDYADRALNEHTFVEFIFQVVLAFPFGIINWFNHDPLNVIFYFLGAGFYSFLLYKVYYKKISNLLHLMVLLNIMAAIFLFAFFLDNPQVITEAQT